MSVVLVTGGCGFIGSNFLNHMVLKYPEVQFVNLDAMYYCASHSNICVSDQPNYTFVKGKIQDSDLVSHILLKYNIDVVIHFAAQSHVDSSFTDSLSYTYDNVYGTHVLLECCRLYGKINRFIHISTDEVYGESLDNDLKTETSILCPTNPYAATKAASELISRSYYYSFNMPIIITRGNNVYGINQYVEKVIPRFIQQLKENKPCTIHGTGENLRAFIHVDDVVRAVDTIRLNGHIGEIYNIGSPDEISVLDLAKKLICLIKGDAVDNFIEYVPDRNFNDKRYYICDEKLKALGWEPLVSFDEGLTTTVSWYLQKTT